MNKIHLQTKLRSISDLQAFTNVKLHQTRIQPDQFLIQQLFSSRKSSKAPSKTGDEMMLSYHPEQMIRKSAPILRTGTNRDFASETRQEKRMKTILVEKKNAGKNVNIRKRIYSSTSPEKKRVKKKGIVDFQVQSKTITRQMCQQQQQRKESYTPQIRKNVQKKEFLKKGQNLNRQIMRNLFQKKMLLPGENEESEIIRLIRLYKGADFIKKKEESKEESPPKQVLTEEKCDQEMKNESIISIAGWKHE